MAPLPHNNTNIYYVDYTFGAGQSHTFQVRYKDPETLLGIGSRIGAYLDDLVAIRPPSWTITGARYQLAGTNFSLATDPPAILPGTAAELSGINYPGYVDFVGRGITSGRRVRWTLFGLNFAVPADYRFSPGEQADLTTVLTALRAGIPDGFITVGGDEAAYYPYVNFGFNSYWEREQRG